MTNLHVQRKSVRKSLRQDIKILCTWAIRWDCFENLNKRPIRTSRRMWRNFNVLSLSLFTINTMKYGIIARLSIKVIVLLVNLFSCGAQITFSMSLMRKKVFSPCSTMNQRLSSKTCVRTWNIDILCNQDEMTESTTAKRESRENIDAPLELCRFCSMSHIPDLSGVFFEISWLISSMGTS